MTKKDIEKTVGSAFSKTAPDVLGSVLERCDEQKGSVLMNIDKKKEGRRHVLRTALIAAALAAALAVTATAASLNGLIGEEEEYMVPSLQESASIDKDGVITITINNLSTKDSEDMEIAFAERKPSEVTSAILTNEAHAYNTFENPDKVKETEFKDFTVTDKGISFKLPACSVIQFRVR